MVNLKWKEQNFFIIKSGLSTRLSPPQLMDYGKLVWRECLAKISKTLESKAVIWTNFDKLWGACHVSKIG